MPTVLKSARACFILYDLKKERYVHIINEGRCYERTSPCSTFKIPLAVIGFEESKFQTPDDVPYAWDGTQRSIPSWNQDHTVRSWMKDSVVWFSQKLVQSIGKKKLQKYIKDFEYGNMDFSGNLMTAWLPLTQKGKKGEDSLRISGFEQINFLKSLYQFRLPVSMNTMVNAQSLMVTELSPKGFVLRGKTGSGHIGDKFQKRLGWYVGKLDAGQDEYLALMTFDDLAPHPESKWGGPVAKEALKEILTSKGLW